MTGNPIRVCRHGRWQQVDFSELSDEELDHQMAAEPMLGWLYTRMLVRFIRRNRDLLELSVPAPHPSPLRHDGCPDGEGAGAGEEHCEKG